MYNEPIFLEPVFQERIWGGEKLRTNFGYTIPSHKTGECWGISAHPNGESVVKNGPLHGRKLSALWSGHPELFGNPKEDTFPLLVKILDAAEDLSVQVHPDDTQAQELEKGEAYGKTECWYVLEAEDGAELVLGHHAESKKELSEYMKMGAWDRLLHKVPIQKGDFFYVPSGTIHAIGKGTLILETQQSSDTTYRVYDYDRLNPDGSKRELHTEKSIYVTRTPHENVQPERSSVLETEEAKVEQLVSSSFFSVLHLQVNGSYKPDFTSSYQLISVTEGKLEIITEDETFQAEKGEHFILPATLKSVVFQGSGEMIASSPDSLL
ncbi:mannose-6-phosphate isomerase type 1 [Sinobaca qinghaiensis]|uniref:Mannose-6-phosphate isomerase n=1 Tax=Sinobaca qinghaiensis TaxID=342944 RepID=A0A419UZH9_9BACL|nr:mannose-6-phosphate isomerase, class I [Sinobaca qinghaiensis]RKD71100.1 mannose-6-phosphate isomerase type 1 [Sinobaca qinghaiensis]